MPEQKRLKLYIVSCHADKPLAEEPRKSVFDCPIQAGAALTDKRTCEINDMTDCADSISDRNSRYSEATAMFWIYRHLNTPYIGIEHYRRRLDLSDDEYMRFMDCGIDIITTTPMNLIHSQDTDRYMSIREHYRLTHYAYDWDLFMDILKRHNVDDYYLALEEFDKSSIHPCNINVFRSDLYREFGDWAFPICDEFYRLSPEKTDVFFFCFVGYIMERLSHLFVIKMKRIGKKIEYAPIKEIRSREDHPPDLKLSEPDQIYNECNALFCENQITNAQRLLNKAMISSSVSKSDERLMLLNRVFTAYLNERSELARTLFEYLPREYRSDLNILTSIWSGFEQIVRIYQDNKNDESLDKLTQYINLTGFSRNALRTAMAIAEGRIR